MPRTLVMSRQSFRWLVFCFRFRVVVFFFFFKQKTAYEMTHVPYRGVAPAMNDLIPGRVDVMFNTTGGLLPQVRAGQVRGLAVTTAERFPTAPELPTVAESGVPGFDVSSWYALFVPARTPADII